MSTVTDILNKSKQAKPKLDYADLSKRKGILSGALLGTAAGFIFGLAKHKNLIVSTLVGASIGGILATTVLSFQFNQDEETEE